MGKALNFGDGYELRYPVRVFDESQVGFHAHAIIGIWCSYESRNEMISLSTWPVHSQGFYGRSRIFRASLAATYKTNQSKACNSKGDNRNLQDAGSQRFKSSSSSSPSSTLYLNFQPQPLLHRADEDNCTSSRGHAPLRTDFSVMFASLLVRMKFYTKRCR